MKCKFNQLYTGDNSLDTPLYEWLTDSPLTSEQKHTYISWLNSEGQEMKQALEAYFNNTNLRSVYTPVWIHSEVENSLVTLMIKQDNIAQEPGEQGSILAYARAYGYQHDFLYSDCYGQLSCSSCAVEVLQGECLNSTPKDEEYDMLDIDIEKPPTKWTRLSCQASVGHSPLFCRIRKPVTS